MTQLAVIDFETTGLTPGIDEILQVSIIDETGAVLLDEYCCPQRHTSWDSAQKINGIAPQQVAQCAPFEDLCERVRAILQAAQRVIAYNVSFEQGFLQAYGIAPSSLQWGADPMQTFSALVDNQKRTLATAAAFLGFSFAAHNALEDVKATLFLYQAMESGSLLMFLLQGATQADQQESGLQYLCVDAPNKLRILKILGLCPFTFTKEKALVYQGVFSARPMACEVVGFQNRASDNDWLIVVLRVNDALLCVGDDYLREMQAPTFGKDATAVSRQSRARIAPQEPQKVAAPQRSGKFAAFAQKSSAIKNLTPNADANPENPLFEKNIVFTGDMTMQRDEAAQAVSQLGALVKSGVSAKTDYLVIGAQDAALVGADGISGKEEKAMLLNESKKASIQLLKESEFQALLASAQAMS